jgi:hypothetical protein
MARHFRAAARTVVFSLVTHAIVETTGQALAGHRTRRRGQTVVATQARSWSAPTKTLGTFYPTPYLMVRGNSPIGGGYSPLDIYGDQTMVLYGPLSALRATTAPVVIYTRGYDGQISATEALSFSNPNLPEISPVIYPTEANNFYGPRVSRTPPWGANGINWIDQN